MFLVGKECLTAAHAVAKEKLFKIELLWKRQVLGFPEQLLMWPTF